jgi:hypothetical protein
MRVGVVGTESTHVRHIVRYCNVEHRAGDARVVAVAAADRDIGIPCVVDRAEDLLGLVDAVIVANRDGRVHAARALPFLTAGLPTFVDKPFACDLRDAEAMVRVAERHHAPLTSYSALRWHPALAALAAGPPPRSVVATGPADPASPYAGIHFYGAHPVEVALILAPGSIGDVHVRRVSGAIVAGATVGDTAVVVHLVRPAQRPVPFHAMVVREDEVTATELPLDPDYLYPGLDAFFRMARTGEPPAPYDELLRPVRFLAAVAARLTDPA